MDSSAVSAPEAVARPTGWDDFSAAYVAKFDRMVGQLCRMGLDRERATDVVQDAFAARWEKRHQLRDRSRLSGRVLISAIHRAYSLARRDSRLV